MVRPCTWKPAVLREANIQIWSYIRQDPYIRDKAKDISKDNRQMTKGTVRDSEQHKDKTGRPS